MLSHYNRTHGDISSEGNYEGVDILVIEDDPDDSELTLSALQKGNHKIRVIHLWDGVEALKLLFDKNSNPGQQALDQLKLILLNLNLPKLNGLEVLKKIRENVLTKTTPVVILSSYRRESTIAEAYRMGANSYVVKPTRFDAYMHTVSSLAFYWSVVNERPSITMI